MFKLLKTITLGITTVRKRVDNDITFYLTEKAFDESCEEKFKKSWDKFKTVLAESTANQINRRVGTLRKALLPQYTRGHGRQNGTYLTTVSDSYPSRNPPDPLQSKWEMWKNEPLYRIHSNKDLKNLRLTFSAEKDNIKIYAKTNTLYHLTKFNNRQSFSNYRKVWIAHSKNIPNKTKKRKRNEFEKLDANNSHSNNFKNNGNSNSNTNSNSNSKSNKQKKRRTNANTLFMS